MSYTIAPDGIVPIHSLPELSSAITHAAITAQERPNGLYIAEADFDPAIAGRIVGFAERATSAQWGQDYSERERNYLIVEGTDSESAQAITVASRADPELTETFNLGMDRALPHIHWLGASLLRSMPSSNISAGNNRPMGWHKDWSRQVAVVIAPDPFEAVFAKTVLRGKIGYSQSHTMPAGIIGIRGTGALLDFVQHGVAHAFNNPEPTPRHSVVANAWVRPGLIRGMRFRSN